MQKISIIDVLTSESFREAQMSIKGEGAHRLNLLLIFEFNRVGRFRNRIECDQRAFTAEMGYKDLSAFKRARKALVKAGVWEYHKSTKVNKFGIKAGYFSLPAKFLKEVGADMAPTETQKQAKIKEVGADMAPTQKADSDAGLEAFLSSKASKKKEVGADMAPTQKADSSKEKETKNSKKERGVGADMAPYIYRELIDNIDIDIDSKIKLNLKKLIKSDFFATKYKSKQVVDMQVQQLKTALTALSTTDTLEVIEEVTTKAPTTDTLNYLITSLRDKKSRLTQKNQIKHRKNGVKKAYTRKKHIEVATDWSKKKAKHVDFDAKAMKDFFKKFEEENGMTKGENDDRS